MMFCLTRENERMRIQSLSWTTGRIVWLNGATLEDRAAVALRLRRELGEDVWIADELPWKSLNDGTQTERIERALFSVLRRFIVTFHQFVSLPEHTRPSLVVFPVGPSVFLHAIRHFVAQGWVGAEELDDLADLWELLHRMGALQHHLTVTIRPRSIRSIPEHQGWTEDGMFDRRFWRMLLRSMRASGPGIVLLMDRDESSLKLLTKHLRMDRGALLTCDWSSGESCENRHL